VGLHCFSPGYYGELVDLTKKLELEDQVIFKEYASEAEMKELYSDADVFVFPNDGLTWGISVFEAIAAGLPVVITNNVGAADLVKNGTHGQVVEPRNPMQLAESIKDNINDRNRAAEMSRSAFAHVKELVSWEAYAQRMVALLDG